LPVKTELKAALFDLDDTLVDRRTAYNKFYRGFYDTHEPINRDVSWAEAKDFFWTLSPNNATNPREAFKSIQQRWPDVKGDSESHYHDYFSGLSSSMRPLPGAVEFIEVLNESGLPWGVVTNGNSYQLKKVEAAGLQDLVPFVVATELHGANKPDPAPFRTALRLLELDEGDASSVLFVGDNPHTDISGAHAVGMQTAWIHMGREYPAGAPKPDITIASVSELMDVLGI
jgi:putative hydrolase of the HAD superfamily